MLPRDIQALFAPSAHFVKAECCERADQCETCREREEERQHVRAKHDARQHETDHRIDETEKHRVARHREKILEAARERVLQIRQSNYPDLRLCLTKAFAADHMRMRHAFLLRLKAAR